MNTNKTETNITGSIIRRLRSERGLTLEQVGNAVGVAKSTVKKWEDGSIANMGIGKLIGLAEALGTSPAELLGVTVPVKGANLYMINENDLPTYNHKTKKSKRYAMRQNVTGIDYCVVARDNSMQDAGIHEHDNVFISKSRGLQDGNIAAIYFEDDEDVILRRLFFDKENGAIQLVPASAEYAPQVISGKDVTELNIIGVAVSVERPLI